MIHLPLVLVNRTVLGQHNIEDGVVAEVFQRGDLKVEGYHPRPVFRRHHLDLTGDADEGLRGKVVGFNRWCFLCKLDGQVSA